MKSHSLNFLYFNQLSINYISYSHSPSLLSYILMNHSYYQIFIILSFLFTHFFSSKIIIIIFESILFLFLSTHLKLFLFLTSFDDTYLHTFFFIAILNPYFYHILIFLFHNLLMLNFIINFLSFFYINFICSKNYLIFFLKRP